MNIYKYKWAGRISKKYQNALKRRGDRRPPGWDPPEEQEMIWRTAKLDRCGCDRKIKGHATMMVYDGAEEGVNSSVSTCSKHSYLRGAKQRVNNGFIGFNIVLLILDVHSVSQTYILLLFV